MCRGKQVLIFKQLIKSKFWDRFGDSGPPIKNPWIEKTSMPGSEDIIICVKNGTVKAPICGCLVPDLNLLFSSLVLSHISWVSELPSWGSSDLIYDTLIRALRLRGSGGKDISPPKAFSWMAGSHPNEHWLRFPRMAANVNYAIFKIIGFDFLHFSKGFV